LVRGGVKGGLGKGIRSDMGATEGNKMITHHVGAILRLSRAETKKDRAKKNRGGRRRGVAKKRETKEGKR